MGSTKKAKGSDASKAGKKGGRGRARKRPAEPMGLTPAEVEVSPPDDVRKVAKEVRAGGATVLSTYREPVGGHWTLLVAVPIEQVGPTPYQRDASKTHVQRIARVIEKVDRFLDPIILCRAGQGKYWTPNGNHRLEALKSMNARAVVGLLVPESEIARQILALNTEKGYNLREKALGALRLLRTLVDGGEEGVPAAGPAKLTEASLAFELEEPFFLTLGVAYESRGRFSGGAYQPILRRVDTFLEKPLTEALEVRNQRAGKLLEADDVVSGIVERLKKKGFQSPYLKAFVVARVNPVRFHKGEPPSYETALEKMLSAASRFDVDKVRGEDLARTGGPPEVAD